MLNGIDIMKTRQAVVDPENGYMIPEISVMYEIFDYHVTNCDSK